MYMHAMCEHRSEDNLWHWSSPTMWVPGIKLKSSWASRAFTNWIISLALFRNVFEVPNEQNIYKNIVKWQLFEAIDMFILTWAVPNVYMCEPSLGTP